MTHYTFPNGAVQGGAFADPTEFEMYLKRSGAIPMTHEERLADLMAAFEQGE